ncbi:MAG: RnfABCDGE type electron transport complex subunit B [Evtepia sp.]
MGNVITALVVLGVMGAAFGLILGVAAKVFAVEVDERETAITECLPGANCGGCGFPGCGGYAAAVVKGEAPVNACAPGGAAVATQIAEIMGVTVDTSVRKVAQVQCTGKGCDKLRYDYVGLQDCLAIARMSAGGPLQCQYGCLGGGTCVSECPFDAIHIVDGVAKVDEDACVACNRCVTICPRNIIELIPRKTKKHVAIPCSSKAKGAEVRKGCDDGCIGCSLCLKACPKEAIVMENNLAKIDYEKCIGCGICAQKCPRKLITVDGVVPEQKPVKPAAKPDAAVKAEPAKPVEPDTKE